MGFEVVGHQEVRKRIFLVQCQIATLSEKAIQQANLADKYYRSNDMRKAQRYMKKARLLSEHAKSLSLSYAALQALLL